MLHNHARSINLLKLVFMNKGMRKFNLIPIRIAFVSLLFFTSNTSNFVDAQIDKEATRETKTLYNNLKKSADNGIIFGAQTTTSMGIGWTSSSANPLQSDVKKATGDFPGVFGFDFKKWHFNLDEGWMTGLEQVKEIYRRGGIVTFSWHTDNPVTGGSCNDTTNAPLRNILPGGASHDLFNSWLDSIARFAHLAKVDGVHVPILFRPFHENTGRWFWWGSMNRPEDYIAAFRYVVDYLKNTKDVHSFLYVFSPSKPQNQEHYLQTYPGDEYVDVLGFDTYMPRARIEGFEGFDKYVNLVVRLANEKDKIAAIAETGVVKGIQNFGIHDWFSKYLLFNKQKTSKIAYCMTWHNHAKRYWIPLKGDPMYADFLKFYNDPSTLFLNDIQGIYDND